MPEEGGGREVPAVQCANTMSSESPNAHHRRAMSGQARDTRSVHPQPLSSEEFSQKVLSPVMAGTFEDWR